MRGASPARVAAVRALVEVEEGAHLEEALSRLAPEPGLDRELSWFLAFGVLRRRGHVDAALRPALSRPLGSLDPEIRAVLRIGAFEHLFARTRAYAIVHQGVEVARALGLGRASGLVNAVLRRVQPAPCLTPAEALDHPDWLLSRWTERYGAEAAVSWCKANAEIPPLFLVARSDELTSLPPGRIEVSLGERYMPRCFRLEPPPGGPIPGLPGFAEGAWWIQDLASVAVADLVGAGPGMRVLDICAAPGGKSFRMASFGASVLATDRSAERLQLLEVGAARLGLSIEARVHDWSGAALSDAVSGFDAVLVDAPCTALGTVRRHPEIRWRRQLADLRIAAQLQARILEQASVAVAPGGTLVYAVCSPEPEEGSEVVESFLAEHEGFELEEGLQTAPPSQGEDAHFAVRMRRLS